MPQRISVRVPATSANLGCLFDCAALALNLYLDVHVASRRDGAITVRYRGATPDRIPLDHTNLIARTMKKTLESWEKPVGFDLEIENQIPIGVGLGSSAAAIVAALAASYRLAATHPSDEQLLSLATRIEGHPDNVAAAWLGGFAVAVQHQENVFAYSCPVAVGIELAVVVPDYPLSTEKARAVLPAQYSRADAIHNLQRAAIITALLFSGKQEFQTWFFEDRWHQPHRAPLVPGLAEALAFEHPDLLGVCLSGAGPSILAFARKNAPAIGDGLKGVLAAKGVKSQALALAADNRGCRGWS